MGTLIHAVGHGLIADDTIMLGNLVGGEGLSENTVYYVLAAGLTLDDFAVSESSGGTAVAYTTDITDGVIVRTDTYTAVSDGVMDPPDAVAEPDQPVLSSNTDTGVVRIVVTLVAPTSPKVRAVEVQLTNQYSIPASAPDGPIFTDAETITVQPSLTTFSVKAHPSTYYSARVRHIDVYGTASAWTVPFYGAYANILTDVGFDAVAAVETSALDHEITTVEIGEHQITAPLLEATLVLASTIIAGTPNDDRLEMDSTGLTLYDGATAMRARLPTDTTQPVFVRGTIEADTLESASASLAGETSLPMAAVVTAQSGIVKPTAAPTLAASVETSFTMTPTPTDQLDVGISYDSGNTSWWAAYWVASENSPDSAELREFDLDGTVLRTLNLEIDMADYVRGVGVTSTHVFVLYWDDSAATLVLRKLLKSDLSFVSSTVIGPTGTPRNAAMFYDATDDRIVIVTATGTGAGVKAKFYRYDQTPTWQDTVTDVAATFTFNGTTTLFNGGARAEGSYWVDVKKDGSTNSIECYSTAGQHTADRTFGTVAGTYRAGLGIGHNGTYFYGSKVSGGGAVCRFTNWDWTTASAKYWVGYSWYDSGGTDETQVGPLASITMTRRSRLAIQHAARPAGTTSVFIYAKPDASSPAAGTMEYQAANGTAYLSASIDTYETSGKNDETANGFPAGTAAELKSGSTGWTLKGSGLINRTGTAFPTSPATDDQYFRSDIGMEFFYDGTRWLSTQLFEWNAGPYTSSATHAVVLAATNSATQRCSTHVGIGTDIWLVKATSVNVVNTGGTALSASHKWVGTLSKVSTANAVTTIGTFTIDSGGSAPTWHPRDGGLTPALLGTSASYPTLRLDWTKTGTPGTLSIAPGFKVMYRIVQT